MRDHVIAGRRFDSIADLDGAFHAWLPIRRGQVHRTHEQVIAVRAEADRAALRSLPDEPYLVTEKHLRRVGRDCLISFDASHYSVPARHIRPGQQVQVQVLPDPAHGDQILIHAVAVDGGGWLASHPRAARRGAWQVDPDHWAGLPDGHTRSTIVEPARPALLGSPGPPGPAVEPLAALLHRRHADTPVTARPLTDYHTAATRSTR